MLFLYGILCLILTSASATLRIFHGVVVSGEPNVGARYDEVRGVVALNLRPQTSDLMDCNSTTTQPESLKWEKNGKIVDGTTVELNTNARRLNLGSVESEEELGTFACVDTETNERLIIKITAGAAALCPVTPRETVTVGSDVDLRVYADADPALESEDNTGRIQWTGPNNNIISNGLRFSLFDTGRHLMIQNTSLQDAGTYCIEILQETSQGTFKAQAKTTIELEVTLVGQEVDIGEDTIYAILGSTIPITVTIDEMNQTNIIVDWYYNGSLIDIPNNPQYSLSTDTYSLVIANVSVDVLGVYEVVVTFQGNMNLTDTVSVVLLEPPTAVASPKILTVPENVAVTFHCIVSGTNPTVVWSFEEDSPLPSGVVQNGSDLVISQTQRDQSGVYQCSAINSADNDTSIANLTVFYPPTATIEALEHLQVTIAEGDPAPTFSCSSDGLPAPVVTWRGPHSGDLPAGLSQLYLPDEGRLDLQLVWKRPPVYTDSGQYLCTAMNSNSTSTATLDLLVRYLPVITSVFPRAPVTSASSSTFRVPVGYTGPAITCTAIGWPPPTVQWLFSSGSLTDQTVSNLTGTQNFVSTTLRWESGFMESDAGGYMCTLRDNDTMLINSKDIVLELGSTSHPGASQTNCSLNMRTTYFQLRVLDTDCVSWNTDAKQLIMSRFQDTVQSVVSAVCNFCLGELNGLTINTLQCSGQVSGAAVFTGRISTEETREAEDMFCVLYNWQRNGAYALVNDSYHLVDSNCSVRRESLAEPECSVTPNAPNNSNIAIIAGAAAIGAVLLLTSAMLILACVCVCRQRKKQNSVEVYLSDEPRTDYDRTYPNPDTANDQISPSPMVEHHSHHYSGLSHLSNTSSPSSVHGRQSQDFELRAHSSQAFLLDDTEGQPSRQSTDGNIPNIYKMDLLDDFNGSPRQSSDLDDNAIDASGLNNPQYEVIARKHPLRTSSSSGKVSVKDRLLRASLASAFSTGNIRTSSISSRNQDHDLTKDYCHLDRGDTPRASTRSIKGLRVSSLIMSNPPSLPPSPALHHRGKQPTVPGYSTYSPKLQDSPLLTDSCSPSFTPTLPYSTLAIASSRTADYEEITTPIHRAGSQDVLVSHDYSEPRELEKRRPSFPVNEGIIPPYSMVSKSHKESGSVLMEGYGEPSALGIPTLGRKKPGEKSMISPYSQVSNIDIDSYAYNHPTALDRPEIPSYGTVPEQKPRLARESKSTHHGTILPHSHASNSEISHDSDVRGRHSMSNRQLPKIPSSKNIQPTAQNPGNTIPPYSQVNKPRKKNSGTEEDDDSVNSSQPTIQLYSEVADSGAQESDDLPGNHSCANTPISPRKILPYSQVNIDQDVHQKKISVSSLLEPIPYSEPIRRNSRKSEPTPPVFKLLDIPRKGSEPTTYTNPLPSSGVSGQNILSPLLQRAPSPYSEPMKSHQLEPASEFTFTFEEKHSSFLFNEPSPYAEPVMSSTSANKTGDCTPGGTIPLDYSEPVTRTNSQKMESNGHAKTDSQISMENSTSESTIPLPYSEPVVRQRMERNSRGSSDSQLAAEKISTITQRMDRSSRGSNDSQIASPYCEPRRSRNKRK